MIALVFGEHEQSTSGFHHTQTTNFLSEYHPDLKGAQLSPENLWDEALGRVLMAFLVFPVAFV